jgi:hypothetical protein
MEIIVIIYAIKYAESYSEVTPFFLLPCCSVHRSNYKDLRGSMYEF